MNPYLVISDLQYRVKSLEHQVALFQSGEKYLQLQELREKDAQYYNRQIRDLERQNEASHRETIHVRDLWMDAFEAAEKEKDRIIAKKDRIIEDLMKRLTAVSRGRDDALDQITELRKQLKAMQEQLDDANGRIAKLIAQINRDYENSSIPSSQSPNHKKIANSREKTGRRPGGQPGHEGHRRKRQKPTDTVVLPTPQAVLDDPDFKKTTKVIKKQMVGIRMALEVTEYQAEVWHNSKTGEYVHADFPPGVVNDVNYDSSIKAFLYLLNTDCCTSIDKARLFLRDITAGQLDISKGMVSTLGKSVRELTEEQLKETFSDMLLTPVMHTDCTNARCNGRSAYVFVCASPDGRTLYFARETKGHKGVQGTVTEDYQGILVHDHESTFYSYGSAHQECCAHVLRYLKCITSRGNP